MFTDGMQVRKINVILSDYLGNVDNKGDKSTQIDVTVILRAILAADMAGEKEVTDEILKSVM